MGQNDYFGPTLLSKLSAFLSWAGVLGQTYWVKSLRKYLSYVNVNPCTVHVFFVRFPFLPLNVISQRCPLKVRRKRTFQDTGDSVICASTRSWHDYNVSRPQKDGDRFCVPCHSSNQEDGGITQTCKQMHSKMQCWTSQQKTSYEIEIRGDVAQTSERSTWAIKVSCARKKL